MSIAFIRYHLRNYEDGLKNMPPSGGGGCHAHLLRVANHGIRAGLDGGQIFKDLRRHIHGTRPVDDREIWDAIRRAQDDFESGRGFSAGRGGQYHVKGGNTPGQQSTQILREQALDRLIADRLGVTEADILAASPVGIPDDPTEHAGLMLRALYRPEENICIGESLAYAVPGKQIRTAREWRVLFEHFRGKPAPHVIPNPISGRRGKTKAGTDTYRGDQCVSDYRFAVAEFDDIPREKQLAFWAAINLQVAALIDSGGKSIHGWVRVPPILHQRAWDKTIGKELYGQYLVPLGVDPACKNAARLSRMPGHFRAEKGRWQRLLYLAPEGRRVSP